jgi:hypothetical protein
MLEVLTEYFEEGNMEEGMPMVWEREVRVRANRLTTRGVAVYSYSAFAVSISFARHAKLSKLMSFFQAYVIHPNPTTNHH